ncbi:MAG: ATP-dependent Clp protease adaptor ClpS [Thermodesulfovibrionales bacterium]|nr:ATP-dependent Clp protease adaptor ClpS [Thermodesulfovibrionales bacterium]
MGVKAFPAEGSSTFVIEPWNVILLNDEQHTFDEVVRQVMKATGYPHTKAEDITWEAHTSGEALCYAGSRKRCEIVAMVLEEIALGVRLEK